MTEIIKAIKDFFAPITGANSDEGFGKIIPNIDKDLKLIADKYEFTLDTVNKTVYMTIDNFYMFFEDLKDNVFIILSLVIMSLCAAGFCVFIMNGKEVIKFFTALPSIIREINLFRVN